MSHARAPYGLPQANPPDLSAQLVPALEALGFTVQHLTSPSMSLLLAKWSHRAPGGLTYTLSYTHHRPEGGPCLSYVSLAAGELACQCLVTDTHVRKLSEVRLLLLNNRRYKTARQAALAAGTLTPA